MEEDGSTSAPTVRATKNPDQNDAERGLAQAPVLGPLLFSLFVTCCKN